MLMYFANLSLPNELCGLVLSRNPQHGHHTSSHIMNILQTWQRYFKTAGAMLSDAIRCIIMITSIAFAFNITELCVIHVLDFQITINYNELKKSLGLRTFIHTIYHAAITFSD